MALSLPSSSRKTDKKRRTKELKEILESPDICQPWGRYKEDHCCVKISGIAKNKESYFVFKTISYTKDGQNTVRFINQYGNIDIPKLADDPTSLPKVTKLFENLKPLNKMRRSGEGEDPEAWAIPRHELPGKWLCRNLVIAFLFDMISLEGKSAVSMILQRLVKYLKLDYHVVSNGGAGTRCTSRFASRVRIESDLLSTGSTTDSTPSPTLETTCEMSGFVKYKSSSLSPDCPAKYEIKTPDIVVYEQFNLDQPPAVKLLVSINSGMHYQNGEQLLIEMLSRIPYQNTIWGLEINSVQGFIYQMIEHVTDQFRCIYIRSKKYYFCTSKFPSNFDGDAFQLMLSDISKILASQKFNFNTK